MKVMLIINFLVLTKRLSGKRLHSTTVIKLARAFYLKEKLG